MSRSGPPTGPLAATVAAVTGGDRTAVDVVETHLRRIEDSQATLNAFTRVTADRALEAAAGVDRRIASGDDPGPLAGVPLAVKDLLDQAGLPNTRGSGLPPTTPDTTAPAVDRLERAGGVVTGRTVLHEMAFGFSSENVWSGPARNPWDPATSCGGSSGGSAAAVAARLVPGAVGTDTGGSVRNPAALCGVIGLKVTHGRVPVTGIFPLAPSLDTVGPLATTVGDVALLYRVMAGHHPDDPWSRYRPVTAPGDPATLRGLRLAVPHPLVDRPLSAEVRAGWDRFCSEAKAAGVEVVDVDVPAVDFPGLVLESTYPEAAAVHRRSFAEHRDGYGDDVAERLTKAMAMDMDDYLAGLAWRGGMADATDAVLDDCDALLTPTVAAHRKTIGVDTIEVDGEQVFYRGLFSCFTVIASQTGQPALSLPVAGPGAPAPSVQLIGRSWGEHRLLEIGAALEAAGLTVTAVPDGWG